MKIVNFARKKQELMDDKDRYAIGQQDFKTLRIDSADWDLDPYPVLYHEFGNERYNEVGKLEKVFLQNS